MQSDTKPYWFSLLQSSPISSLPLCTCTALVQMIIFSCWDSYSGLLIGLPASTLRLFQTINFCCSVAQLCLTLCDPMGCITPGLPVHHQLPELAQTHVHWVRDTIQPSHPLSSPSPPALNISQHQGLFQWVSSSHQVAKGLELQLQHQSFNEYSGLISFKIDLFYLLAVQGTLKSLLQHHSLKASIFRHSACSHICTRLLKKTIALTIRTFVGKVKKIEALK